MSKDEMRLCRREWINSLLRVGIRNLSYIKFFVRQSEIVQFGYELQAYK